MHALLLGFGGWSLAALDGLRESVDKLTLVTYEDRPTRSSRLPFWMSLADHCRVLGVPVVLDQWPPLYRWAPDLKADILFSSNWRHLIPEPVVALHPLGAFNIHRSLLPHFRGASPLNWAVAKGETQTGVSIHLVSSALDGGDIVAQQPIPIGLSDTATVLFQKSESVIKGTVTALLPAVTSRRFRAVPQGPSGHTPFPPRTGRHLRLDWSANPPQLFDAIRAQSIPFPPSYSYLGSRRVEVLSADPPCRTRTRRREPGTVVSCETDGILEVYCRDPRRDVGYVIRIAVKASQSVGTASVGSTFEDGHGD